jgi:hypothetical protein
MSALPLNDNLSDEDKTNVKSHHVRDSNVIPKINVTKTINWRFATLFASKCVLSKESWHAFLERLLLRRALQASLVSGAKYDSLANYASLTTFGHIMVNSMTFARKHLSIAVRQIILPCARICFLSAPIYGISHNKFSTDWT